MSKYKVGDRVLMQMVVDDVRKDNGYAPIWVSLERNDTSDGMWLTEEQIDKYASKSYEDGLNNAWELARKICEMGDKDFNNIFGCVHFSDVFYYNTPQEAFAKIEAYEESKAIKVGDVVRRISGNEEYLIITEEEDDSVYEYGVIVLKSMTIDRITGDLSKFEKTGRHIDIEHLLEQIRGNE